jgi:hypothetical protein
VQGYYFSPPVPFDEATALLKLQGIDTSPVRRAPSASAV